MARPALPEDEKKSRVISCKVTPGEWAEIKSTAEKCGISVCDFVRRRLLGYCPKARMTPRELSAMVELESARSDFNRFKGALRHVRMDLKEEIFGDRRLMERWLRGITESQDALNKYLKRIKYDS